MGESGIGTRLEILSVVKENHIWGTETSKKISVIYGPLESCNIPTLRRYWSEMSVYTFQSFILK